MYSSNYLLSQMGVPYDDCHTQADEDRRLQDALLIFHASKNGTYATANYTPGPFNGPAAVDPANTAKEYALTLALQATVDTGHIDEAHAALDRLNGMRATMGMNAAILPSDLDILAHSHESVGFLLERIRQMDPAPALFTNPDAVQRVLDASDAQKVPPPQQPTVPTVPIDATTANMFPAGFVVTDPTGTKWIVMKTTFGSFLALASALANFRATAALLVAFLLICAGASRASAQVNLRFTPEPMAVPVSVLANARDLGRWSVIGCNDGVAPVAIASERIDMAAGPLRLVSNDDAMLVLTGHQRRSTAGTILHILSLAGQGVAIGVSVAGTIKNPVATTAIGIGSGLLPQLTAIVQGEVPSIVPLQSSVKYPVTLMPGGCFTDYRFAGKMKHPEVVVGVIK